MKSQTVVSWVRLTSKFILLVALLSVTGSACAVPLVVASPKAVPFWPAWVGLRDTNDNPLSSGTISTYDTTYASKSMYLNATKTRTAPNPIVLDQFGRASGNSGKGPIFADGNYNLVVRNASGSIVYSLSNVEFKSIAYPGSLNLSSSIVASLTAYMAQIDAGSIGSATIDGSVITNSDITNASMSTVDMTGVVRIDQASITAADLGTTRFTGSAGSVGHIPGTTATFSGTVGIGENLIVTGDASIQGSFFEVLADMGVSGTIYNASGLQIIGNTIYNVATPTTSTQAANRGYVDAQVAAVDTGATFYAGTFVSSYTFPLDIATGSSVVVAAGDFTSAIGSGCSNIMVFGDLNIKLLNLYGGTGDSGINCTMTVYRGITTVKSSQFYMPSVAVQSAIPISLTFVDSGITPGTNPVYSLSISSNGYGIAVSPENFALRAIGFK